MLKARWNSLEGSFPASRRRFYRAKIGDDLKAAKVGLPEMRPVQVLPSSAAESAAVRQDAKIR